MNRELNMKALATVDLPGLYKLLKTYQNNTWKIQRAIIKKEKAENKNNESAY